MNKLLIWAIVAAGVASEKLFVTHINQVLIEAFHDFAKGEGLIDSTSDHKFAIRDKKQDLEFYIGYDSLVCLLEKRKSYDEAIAMLKQHTPCEQLTEDATFDFVG